MRHRGGRQSQGKRKGKEDAQAQDHLLELAAATAQQTVPEDPVPGAARTRRTRRVFGTHSDPGKPRCDALLYFFGKNAFFVTRRACVPEIAKNRKRIIAFRTKRVRGSHARRSFACEFSGRAFCFTTERRREAGGARKRDDARLLRWKRRIFSKI